jgi:hypothetical protein
MDANVAKMATKMAVVIVIVSTLRALPFLEQCFLCLLQGLSVKESRDEFENVTNGFLDSTNLVIKLNAPLIDLLEGRTHNVAKKAFSAAIIVAILITLVAILEYLCSKLLQRVHTCYQRFS